MKLIELKTKSPKSFMASRFVLCLGNFDGVHLGHRQLIEETVKLCQQLKKTDPDVACGAWLFDDNSYKSVPQIFSTAQKLEAFEQLGLEYAFVADFDKMKGLSPEEFVNGVLKSDCHCIHAVCGENFRFGAKASANASQLVSLMDGNATVVPLFKQNGEVISSTLIRSLLESGEIEKANPLLGYSFYICEPVLHGKALGRTIGIPTINQSLPCDPFALCGGIYATKTYINGEWYPSVTNVGVRPTVESTLCKNAETHVIGFSGDCYGTRIRVEFLSRLRDEVRFSSIDELKEQISKDINSALEYFNDK